jgi:hypothetical protein
LNLQVLLFAQNFDKLKSIHLSNPLDELPLIGWKSEYGTVIPSPGTFAGGSFIPAPEPLSGGSRHAIFSPLRISRTTSANIFRSQDQDHPGQTDTIHDLEDNDDDDEDDEDYVAQEDEEEEEQEEEEEVMSQQESAPEITFSVQEHTTLLLLGKELFGNIISVLRNMQVPRLQFGDSLGQDVLRIPELGEPDNNLYHRYCLWIFSRWSMNYVNLTYSFNHGGSNVTIRKYTNLPETITQFPDHQSTGTKIVIVSVIGVHGNIVPDLGSLDVFCIPVMTATRVGNNWMLENAMDSGSFSNWLGNNISGGSTGSIYSRKLRLKIAMLRSLLDGNGSV